MSDKRARRRAEPRTKSATACAASSAKSTAAPPGAHGLAERRAPNHHGHGNGTAGNAWSHAFSRMANATAHFAGKPQAFLIAAVLVIVWAATGPLFGYSDTWQLVINTSTTIVTFLMVFLIQHTQNRDTLALQLKLAELIICVKDAENRLATAEDMTEEELQELHDDFRRRAEQTLEHLDRRRDALKRAS
jgi:low affinity Fe/Cu permease